jgi:hypothetical protein
MMKEEIEGKIKERILNEEYEIIETVYTWYDESMNKDDVAGLYMKFGIKIFKDLLPRAERIRDMEHKIAGLMAEVAHLNEEREMIIKGLA